MPKQKFTKKSIIFKFKADIACKAFLTILVCNSIRLSFKLKKQEFILLVFTPYQRIKIEVYEDNCRNNKTVFNFIFHSIFQYNCTEAGLV